MKMRKINILILTCALAFTSLGGFVSPKSVEACSCVVPDYSEEGVQKRFNETALIFVGTVKDVSVKSGDILSAGTGNIEFEVSAIYKGETTKRTLVQGARDSAACGWIPEVGSEYVVYAYEEDGVYGTTSCSPNHETPLSENETKVFGEGIDLTVDETVSTEEVALSFWQKIQAFFAGIFSSFNK